LLKAKANSSSGEVQAAIHAVRTELAEAEGASVGAAG
jgi:hypothetical protein